jgi:TetR/AcrR family transcriptional regulator, cholesterol catabolism regulator
VARSATEPTTRRNRDAEILDAATSIFSQKGYSAASLQEIADRVGILKGSLYHYIDSKESLLFRILQDSHEEATAIMQGVDELDLPTEEKFTTYVMRLAGWYLNHRERTSLYQSEWRYLEGDFGKQVRAHRRTFNAYMRAIVEAAVDEKLAPADLDTDLATKFVLSAIDSIPSWYTSAPPKDVDRIAASVTSLAHSSVFLHRTA